jgi:hypothetical protein
MKKGFDGLCRLVSSTHTGGDLTARGNTQRGLANASSLLADASRASIAEHKAQWWQTETPNYLQWSIDIGTIETTYTDDTTDNILQRAMGVKNAGVKYATDVGKSIKDYDVATAAAREEYISKLMTIAKSIGDTLLDAERDKEIALADAELQKQLTGNESAYSSAVQAANDAYTNTTTSAEASRKSQEQTARSTMNTKLSDELKNKEADMAAAEREYDQTVASLDAQYGSESSNGDTGVEGATRRSAIKTRDAQYYAARDTSWANTLSGSTTLGTSPWTVKAITAANAEAAHSVSRANAQAAHDAAMLDAIEDWKLSRNESLTDLLFTEGQSRETYNVATSNVYANWENGVGNLLGGRPEGTGYAPVRGYGEGGAGTMGGAGAVNTTRLEEGDDDPKDSGLKSDETATPRPILPPSEGPIVWLTPQQMLELERQHGLEMMNRFRRAYRVRDPNVGLYPGELLANLENYRGLWSRANTDLPGTEVQSVPRMLEAQNEKQGIWQPHGSLPPGYGSPIGAAPGEVTIDGMIVGQLIGRIIQIGKAGSAGPELFHVDRSNEFMKAFNADVLLTTAQVGRTV